MEEKKKTRKRVYKTDKKVKEIHLLDDKIQELEDKLLRNQAELINFKRRKEEEKLKIIKYSSQEIISKLLPIIDNFERAIAMDDEDKTDEVSKFLEGFILIYNNILEIFQSEEVIEIEALGLPFDPNVHQAVSVKEDKEKKSGTVLEVLQKGYKLKDKLIRPAMVIVNK
ncbi:MAG: nucleotide exchange factor GrpE [Bacilli bacterium]